MRALAPYQCVFRVCRALCVLGRLPGLLLAAFPIQQPSVLLLLLLRPLQARRAPEARALPGTKAVQREPRVSALCVCGSRNRALGWLCAVGSCSGIVLRVSALCVYRAHGI